MPKSSTFARAALVALLATGAVGCLDRPIARVHPEMSGSAGGAGGGWDEHVCRTDADCDGELTCQAGCCVPPFTSGPGGGVVTSGGGETCSLMPDAPVEANVVLLVDRSGSMQNGRWELLHEALMGDGGVVPALEQDVTFAYADYTRESAAACPAVSDFSLTLGSPRALDAAYAPTFPGGDDTPTGESLAAVAAQLADLDLDGTKTILVATDGLPDLCDGPDDTAGGQARAELEAAKAASLGIKTVVLGLEMQDNEGHLQRMANAGAGFGASDDALVPYYTPANEQQLVSDLTEALELEQRCVIEISGAVTPALAAEATVTLDDEPLAFDDPDGWRLRDATHIELMGAACDAFIDGAAVAGSFTCAS